MADEKLKAGACSICLYGFKKDDVLKCRLNPPVTHALIVPMQSIAGQSLGVQLISAHPQVDDDNVCSKFKSDIWRAN